MIVYDWTSFLTTKTLGIDRVGFLPEETYFFRDTRKKVEETYFFQFCPDKTGRNWIKLEKTWKMSEMLEKIIIILNFLQKIICIWLIGTD